MNNCEAAVTHVCIVGTHTATEVARYLLVDPGVSDGRTDGHYGAVEGKPRRKSAESANILRREMFNGYINVTMLYDSSIRCTSTRYMICC